MSKVLAMMVAGVAALASLSGCGGGDASSIQISATAPGTPTDGTTQPGRIHVMQNGDAIFTSFGHHPLTFRLTDAKPPMCD